MATRKSKGSSARSKGRRGKRPSTPDAITLLKADHRQVSGWFAAFDKTKSSRRKLELAQRICRALEVHATIEEEIFYPAFLAATRDKDMHHEAAIEHNAAKQLMAQIENSGPEDDYYDAKVTVLSEMIKHHVKEEEQPGGMFAKARKSKLDLGALGAELQARKTELMNGSGRPAPRGGVFASLVGNPA